jgi:hypothetical protein
VILPSQSCRLRTPAESLLRRTVPRPRPPGPRPFHARSGLSDQQAYSLIQVAQRVDAPVGEAVLRIGDGHFANRHVLELVSRSLADAPAAEHATTASFEILKRALQVVADDAGPADSSYTAGALLRVAISGAAQGRPERWLRMLCAKTSGMLDRDEPLRVWAIRRIQAVPALGLDGTGPVLDQFVAAVREVTQIAEQAGVPLDARVDALRRLPAPLGGRLIATDLAASAELDVDAGVRLVETEVADSDPMPETLSLLRALRERNAPGLADVLARSLGSPPAPSVLAAFDDDDEFPPEWIRAFGWSDALPGEIQGTWADAVARVRERWGAPSQDGFVLPPPTATFLPARSPFDADELAQLPPLSAAEAIASWRPDPADYAGPSTHGVAQALKDLIAANRDAWMSEDAPDIVRTLRDPTYIAAYFEALSATPDPELPTTVLAAMEQLFDVRLLRQRAPGDDPVQLDVTWPVDLALRLMPRLDLAELDVQRRVWALLRCAAHANNAPERASADGTPGDAQTPRYDTYTRTLAAAFSVADRVMLANGPPPPELLSLLDEALALTKPRGLSARTAVAANLPWLMHRARAWTESNWDSLIGQAALDGLGVYTFESYLQYGRPYRPLLASHPELFWAALGSVPDSAQLHILHAMLWEVDGYEPAIVVEKLLVPSRNAISEAAKWLALSASRSDELDIAPALTFWEAAIEREFDPAQYEGFGVFSLVDRLDDGRWLDLTLQTARLCDGRLAFPDRIGTRAAAIAADARAMSLVAALLSSELELWHIYQLGQSGLDILNGPHAQDPAAEAKLRERLLEREFYEARSAPS